MKHRPMDEHGDILPIGSASDLLSGVDAVAEAVKDRLRLLSGEWWEDPNIGFEIPRFLFDGGRIPAGINMLTSYITSYIAQTPDVVSVENVDAVLADRKLIYSCEIVTKHGKQKQEVTSDVLLRALS